MSACRQKRVRTTIMFLMAVVMLFASSCRNSENTSSGGTSSYYFHGIDAKSYFLLHVLSPGGDEEKAILHIYIGKMDDINGFSPDKEAAAIAIRSKRIYTLFEEMTVTGTSLENGSLTLEGTKRGKDHLISIPLPLLSKSGEMAELTWKIF